MPLSPLTHLSGSEQGQPSTDRRAPAAQVRGVEQEGRAVSFSWWMNCTRKKKKKKALLRPYKLWEGTSPFTALKQSHPSPKRRYSLSPRLPDGPRGAPPKQRSPRSRHSAAPPPPGTTNLSSHCTPAARPPVAARRALGLVVLAALPSGAR